MLCPDKWNELEFAGFISWMRSFFIQDIVSRRWKLGHDILRSTILSIENSISGLLKRRYIDLIVERGEAIEEILYQSIIQNEYFLFLELLCSYYKKTGNSLVEKILQFIDNRILSEQNFIVFSGMTFALFCSECKHCRQLIDMIHSIECLSRQKTAYKLLKSALRNFNRNVCTDGNKDNFSNYIELNFKLLDLLQSTNRYEEFEKYYVDFMQVYLYNKEHYGLYGQNCIERYDLDSKNLCFIWRDYANIPINKFRNNPDMSEEEHRLLNEEGTRRWLSVLKEIAWIALQHKDYEKIIAYTKNSAIGGTYNWFYTFKQLSLLKAEINKVFKLEQI